MSIRRPPSSSSEGGGPLQEEVVVLIVAVALALAEVAVAPTEILSVLVSVAQPADNPVAVNVEAEEAPDVAAVVVADGDGDTARLPPLLLLHGEGIDVMLEVE